MQELTNAQKEYFKDSKMRDENGCLKVCYHGTKQDFDSFDNVKKESNFTVKEAGFFFSETRGEADAHGKNAGGQTLEVYLDMKNPLEINPFEPNENSALLNQYMKECFPKVKSWQQDHLCTNKFKEHLQSKGYDSIAIGEPGDKMIIVYEPSQIKAIGNLYPTKDTNFKDNSREYLKAHLKDLSIDECCQITKHIKSQERKRPVNKDKEKSKNNKER